MLFILDVRMPAGGRIPVYALLLCSNSSLIDHFIFIVFITYYVEHVYTYLVD